MRVQNWLERNWFWVFAVIFISYVAGNVWLNREQTAAPQFAPADRSATETGRWIMYNEKDLTAKPGAKTLSISGAIQLEGLNAFVFEKEPPKIKAFADEGWVTQKEYVHHIFPGFGGYFIPQAAFTCSRCETITCPSPNPTPTPTPTPTPEADKSWGRARVHAKEAQALVDTSGVKVCVVDTGIDLQHPNNGVILATQDFSGKGSAQDGAGHGTHTSGTVAGLGGVGISRSKLLICKGLGDNGSGTSSALAQCLTWCGQQGAQIVSNSWGSPQSDGLINQAIANLTAREIYVFVAAGNDSGPVNWPAKLAGSNGLVYAVAASTQTDQIASFSSRGPEIRYISPGDGITSNWPGGGTKSLSGTSMATPHAAAICAFGIAKGRRPCINASGTVAGYPFADAAASAQ